MTSRTGLTPLLLLLLALPLVAQDPPQIPAELKDPKISEADLDTGLRTIDEEVLEPLLEHWKGLVVAKNTELGSAAKAAEEAKDEERDAALKSVEDLREEQAALKSRFQAVLSALRVAKADPEAGKAAADRVANLPSYINLTDPNALWNTVKSWLLSKEGGIKLALNILSFIGILIAFKILSRFVGAVLKRALSARRAKVSGLLQEFFVNTATKTISIIGLIVAVGELGVDIAPLLAGIGVMGFVIGFALQGTLANFAAGIMILINRPYDVGHTIEAAGAKGTVSQMNLFSTTLKTADNQTIVIPNGSIWGGVITNITGNPTRRVDLVFGISYEDDVERAEEVLKEIVASHPKVLENPATNIRVGELADSSVNFVVRPWVNTADYWDVHFDLHKMVKTRFDKEGISIPYPQRQVHMTPAPSAD